MSPLYPKTHIHLLDFMQGAFDTLRVISSSTEDKKTNKIDANH